jgi:hypothetical protein
MKGLFSSLVALVYCVAIVALVYMSAAPALSQEPSAASVAEATDTTAQPS